MKFFIFILFIPIFLFSIHPTLESYDSSHIVLSFPCIQNASSYNIYRLPFISKRRDAKPRLYDKLFLTQPAQNCIYEDWYPFDLTNRSEEYVEYIITYINPDGLTESSFFEAYSNRLILQKPKANFSINSENFCPETTINFSNSSTGLVSEIFWYLGNEIIGEGQEISHIFQEPGEYEIMAEAIGPIGRSYLKKKIEIHQVPVPKIEGENYACESTILYTEEGKRNYKWYYEGEEIQGENKSSLNVSNPGIYNVSYIDENSCFGKSQGFEFSHFEEPNSSFEISSSEIPAGEFLYFINKSKGEGLKFYWDFGDGNKSMEENPVYVYRRAGIYTVKLNVKDICGKEANYEAQVNVTPGLFEISKDNGTIAGGTPVKITGNNFPENPKVYIGNKICQIVSSKEKEIEILTPPHFGGFDYYDIEIKDINDNLIYKMNKMFRYINFGFVAFSNKVSVIDMDKLEFYGWEIEIENPKAINLEGEYAYIGGKGIILKFNSGKGEIEKVFNLEAEDNVMALAIEEGLYGKYLFASIYNQTVDPKGKILIFDEEINLLAFSDFKGSKDGAGLEFEKEKGKVYLLSNGSLSESENQEHKKKMIINIYNPMDEFEEIEGFYYLPLYKILSQEKDSPNSYFNGAITINKNIERLYYGDPINQKIVEINTKNDTFKGPDMETSNIPISILSYNLEGQNFLLNLSKENSILEVYNLPENGKKDLQRTLSLSNYGCIEPKYITKYNSEGVITCKSKIIFFDLGNFNITKEFSLDDILLPEKIKVQIYEEVLK